MINEQFWVRSFKRLTLAGGGLLFLILFLLTVLTAQSFEVQADSKHTELTITNSPRKIAESSILMISQVVTPTIASTAEPQSDDQNDSDIQATAPATGEPLSYPQPVERPVEEPAYPQPQFQPTLSNIQPFSTPPSNNSSAEPIESIGGSFDDQQNGAADTGQTGSSTIFLWLGFVVAMMIFITGVYGSIVLFTRQRSSGK